MKVLAGPAPRMRSSRFQKVSTRPHLTDNPLSAPAVRGAEFGNMSRKQFGALRELAFTHAGLSIADFKKVMVQRRIKSRLTALSLPSVSSYLDYLSQPQGSGEIQSLINALTTNKTSFFRESDQLDHLQSVVLPRLMAAKTASKQGRLRIWTAGCSSGEEAWSVAMTVAATLTPASEWDARVLASDIDTDILEKAKAGLYPLGELDTVPREFRKRFFKPIDRGAKTAEVTDILRRMITFRHFNLHEQWPLKGPFDVIFCRNVMIYFDKPSQKRLVERFVDVLEMGGIFYSGHSECLHGLSKRLHACGRSIYRRVS
jgi:chemotaxis protein methyltransferase CheR